MRERELYAAHPPSLPFPTMYLRAPLPTPHDSSWTVLLIFLTFSSLSFSFQTMFPNENPRFEEEDTYIHVDIYRSFFSIGYVFSKQSRKEERDFLLNVLSFYGERQIRRFDQVGPIRIHEKAAVSRCTAHKIHGHRPTNQQACRTSLSKCACRESHWQMGRARRCYRCCMVYTLWSVA